MTSSSRASAEVYKGIKGGSLLPIFWVLARWECRSIRWVDFRSWGSETLNGVINGDEELTEIEYNVAQETYDGSSKAVDDEGRFEFHNVMVEDVDGQVGTTRCGGIVEGDDECVM